MKFNIIDTESIYRRLLAEPDAAAREAIYRAEFVEPYAGLARIFGEGDGLAMFRQWGMFAPEQFAREHEDRARIAAMLDRMAADDAWTKVARALEEGRAAFAPYADRIPLDEIVFGLFLTDGGRIPPTDRGYSGFGGIPGWIMVTCSAANDYTLPRLKAAAVHELLHNVDGAANPDSPIIVSVGRYIVGEGLAESFAAELYGEEAIGFYVTDFDAAQLETARRVIGAALDVTGFDQVRAYVFGEAFGLPKVGVPTYGGYAIGYRVVQAYLKRTGKTVPETLFVPAEEIIRESGFF